jgi:RND family efflux transporter MFP subunit
MTVRNTTLLMLGLGGLMLAVGCGRRNALVTPPPPKVTVARPLLRPVQEYFETTGQTAALAAVDLRARVGGYLEEIKFKDGSLVKKGDLLFVIDQDPYIATAASAEANLEKAKAQLRLAEQQLARTKQLAAKDAATESALDTQTAQKAVTTAEVAAAEAALRQARLDLEHTEIRAPFSGRMGRHLVDIGNLVVAGETLLASLQEVDRLYAYFTLSEHDLLRFMDMQKAGKLRKLTEADPLQIDLALGETDDFRFHGLLEYREFGINTATGTTDRRVIFQNPNDELLPGLFVRLRAKVGEPRPMLLVDERAVGSDQRGDYLLVVNEKNIVETHMVQLGSLNGQLRAIESGITENDLVVIVGLQRARPGAEVEPEIVEMDARIKRDQSPADASAPASPPAAADAKNEK